MTHTVPHPPHYHDSYPPHYQKLLEHTNESIKVTGYKINTQKSILFLYTNNKQVQTEIQSAISFAITPKKILQYKSNKTCKESRC